MILRPYQNELRDTVYGAWESGNRNVLAVLPTGSGKTVLFSTMIKENRGPAVAIAHRQEIVTQISLSLAKHQVRHRIIGPANVVKLVNRIHIEELGKSWYHPQAPVAVAGVDTLIRRDNLRTWADSVSLWVQDEAHHVQKNNKWGSAAEMFPNARGLGVTATPCRADGRGLGFDNDGLFHAMVQGPGMRDLINQGYLSEYRIFCPTSQFDWSSMKIGSDGDYTLPSAKAALSKSTIVGDVVASYLRFAPGKLGITFATDLETAALIAEKFRAAGVPAELISSNTSDADRVAILRRFRRRETMQLVNVDLVGEGFDVPGVEVVSMARPTKSFALFAQQFGRALRPVEGKVAIIIDHVGNIVDIYTGSVNHGLPDAPRIHTLDRRERRERDKDPSIIPIKACPNCASTYERIYKVCPWCGYEPQPLSRSGPEFVDGDLTELDAVTLARLRGEAVDMAITVPEYLAKSGAGALGHIIATASGRRFERKQKAQNDLRASMAQWAGYQKAMGRPDSESYRLFYFLFGTDVLSAQALGQRDAENLKLHIDNVVSTL